MKRAVSFFQRRSQAAHHQDRAGRWRPDFLARQDLDVELGRGEDANGSPCWLATVRARRWDQGPYGAYGDPVQGFSYRGPWFAVAQAIGFLYRLGGAE